MSVTPHMANMRPHTAARHWQASTAVRFFARALCASFPLAPFCTLAQNIQAAQSPCVPEVAQHQTLEQLLANTPFCQRQPDWLAHLGHQLNTQGRYTEAAEHLERALLLAPQHLGAAFAYTIALAGSGDTTSALHLLAQLTQRPDVPATLHAELLAAQHRMAHPLPTVGWQLHRHAALRLGHDTNLLGSPRLSTLTLTLPGGDLTLPVDSSNLPRPGHYYRADLRVQATHTQTNGRRTDISLALQQRNTPNLPSTNNTLAEFLLETTPTMQGVWGNAATTHLHTQSGTRYRQTAAGGGWAWGMADGTTTCQPRTGLEWQHRNLLSNTLLSSHYTGALAAVHCTSATPSLWAPSHWQLSLRHGQDNPTTPTRPGGKQHSTSLHTSAQWRNWLLHAEVTHTQDHSGYSTLLGNNQLRRTTRTLLRAEYHWQLATQWQAHVGVETYRQQSNISLFGARSTNTYISLRKNW